LLIARRTARGRIARRCSSRGITRRTASRGITAATIHALFLRASDSLLRERGEQ
jgi:hypothetical protein